MKTITIKAEYLIKSDLVDMLERLANDLKNGKTTYYKIESNIGGKLVAEIEEHELEDLRK